MLVNAAQFPAPAMWQGLMLIVIAVWLPWMFSRASSGKSFAGPAVVLALATVAVSLLVWWVMR